MKNQFKEIFRRFEVKALVGASVVAPLMCVTAFAQEPPATELDLVAIMTTSATKIVGDLMEMIASVLPVTVTLLAASIGIAYGIKFIKKITSKAG